MTPSNTNEIWSVNTDESYFKLTPRIALAIRPSMYLKANIVISNNNIGNGTYEQPYSIELDIQ